jgi:hypothetical protein
MKMLIARRAIDTQVECTLTQRRETLAKIFEHRNDPPAALP